MKKVVFICCAIAAMCACFTSCDENGNGYEGTNYIYLSSTANSMFDTEDAVLTVDVALTTALKEDLVLTFISDDTEDIITLEGNPVTIKAGEKNGTFTVRTAMIMEASKNFKITLSEETALPEKVVLESDFLFTVNSSNIKELTEAQQAIVDSYLNATGINLNEYLGLVNVETVYTASNPDSEIALEPVTIKGQTIIALSEASTADKPVLKMVVNPMGIQDVTYEKLKDLTLENPMWAETWEEGVKTSYMLLLEAVNWTAESNPEFKMSLDGITLNADKSIDFIADKSYIDEYGDEYAKFIVPFEYYFSAYEDEKKALAEGTIGGEDWLWDATVNPEFHINRDDTSVDFYGYGNWTEATAAISGEKLEFTFCVYNYNDYDYTKVTATYTPNK